MNENNSCLGICIIVGHATDIYLMDIKDDELINSTLVGSIAAGNRIDRCGIYQRWTGAFETCLVVTSSWLRLGVFGVRDWKRDIDVWFRTAEISWQEFEKLCGRK